jgi:ABC-type uncharacterized transport system involved in gliding motility auxiliary subunit
MAQAETPTRNDRADRLMTVISGWAALVIGLASIHRWVVSSNPPVWGIFPGDAWARMGVILAVVLFIMWVWGWGPEIGAWVRNWKRTGGLNTSAIALFLIIALIAGNAWIRKRVVLKADLTKNQRFTLAPRSREIVKGLKEPLKATVFIPAGRSSNAAQDLFRQYADASPKVEWKQVDPLVDQATVLKMQPQLNQSNLTGAVLEYGGKRENLTEFTEKAVTSAILKLTRTAPRKILFLKGHGEPDISGGAADPRESIQMVIQNLKESQWPVESVDLYRKETPAPDPADAAVLIICGPKRDLAASEKEKINGYLNKGGRVLLLLDLEGPPLSALTKEWGIKTADDVVLGTSDGGLMLTQSDSSSHEAVRAGRRVLFTPMHSVEAITPSVAGLTVNELLNSGGNSQVFSGFKPKVQLKQENAKPGPIGLACMSEKSIGAGDTAKKARIIVFGGDDWFSDQWTRQQIFFNFDLATSVINYLGEEEALVAIPAKDENTEQAFLTPEKGRELLLIHFIYFPLLALILSIVIYLKRR